MKWTIENMKRQIETGLVVEVAYRVVAKSGGLISDHRGKVILVGDHESEGFIPFNQLTESQVIEWVKKSVDVNEIEERVQNTLNQKLSRDSQKETTSGLPWSKNLLRKYP